MSATYWTDLERYAALILPECIADCPNHDADYPGGCVSCNSRAERYAQAIVEEEAVVRDVEGLNRDDQIAGLMQDMVLSRVAKGLMFAEVAPGAVARRLRWILEGSGNLSGAET